jgi:hypothetical protein
MLSIPNTVFYQLPINDWRNTRIGVSKELLIDDVYNFLIDYDIQSNDNSSFVLRLIVNVLVEKILKKVYEFKKLKTRMIIHDILLNIFACKLHNLKFKT